jgi:hypothetical protein
MKKDLKIAQIYISPLMKDTNLSPLIILLVTNDYTKMGVGFLCRCGYFFNFSNLNVSKSYVGVFDWSLMILS